MPLAAVRIAAAFPQAKLVAVLRDPVQRALSGWNMARWVHLHLHSIHESPPCATGRCLMA